MRLAYADPPYLGMGAKLYGKFHPDAAKWDGIDAHRELIDFLVNGYPDGWAMSLSSPTLRQILPLCPPTVRVAAWVKPFASFKPNVNPAYAWEPVIFHRTRQADRTEDTIRDYLAEPITLKKGLPGAKPMRFNQWVLDLLGYQPGDTVDDIFPGTNGMSLALAQTRPLSEVIS